MRIGVIGTGYVGLVSGACFAELGTSVVCMDTDARKIDHLRAGVVPIFEPGLEELVSSNVAAGRLSFTTSVAEAVRGAGVVFITVGTPGQQRDGRADMAAVFAVARQVAAALTGYAVVVAKSTVPPGTCRQMQQIIAQARPGLEFDVASNPEFLREGAALKDFMRPDRVLVGVDSVRAAEALEQLYRPISALGVPTVSTTLETAELAKYACNAFLAAKVTFINEMADLCERLGTDVRDIARTMGLDGRIGPKFLHPGPGFGGSCFPKDTLALLRLGQEVGVPSRLVEAVVAVNDRRKQSLAGRVIAACGGSVAGRAVAVLGLTFKANTDDLRESPSLELIPALQAAGAQVRAHDPKGLEGARQLLPQVTWCDDPYAAMEGASALVVVTEWNLYRSLDLERMRRLLKEPVVVDLRNIFDPEQMRAGGFRYSSVGRGVLTPTEGHPRAPNLSAARAE